MAEITHRTAAFAQIGLSMLYITGFFALVYLFVDGKIGTPKEWENVLMVLIGALTGGVGQILTYWFSRQRTSAAPSEEGAK